jgi:hypothetical protein
MKRRKGKIALGIAANGLLTNHRLAPRLIIITHSFTDPPVFLPRSTPSRFEPQ